MLGIWFDLILRKNQKQIIKQTTLVSRVLKCRKERV